MTSRFPLAALALLLGGAVALADEQVAVPGSSILFPTPIENTIGGRTVKLNLTGTGLRKKLFFKVYAIASYLEDGVAARTGEELAGKDCAKQLHLVLERDVSGRDFSDALRAAIRANYPAPQFEKELTTLCDAMAKHSINQGDNVWLTHVPHVGLHCQLVGKLDIQVKSVAFAQALWEAYVGKNCIADDMRRGLLSRLPR